MRSLRPLFLVLIRERDRESGEMKEIFWPSFFFSESSILWSQLFLALNFKGSMMGVSLIDYNHHSYYNYNYNQEFSVHASGFLCKLHLSNIFFQLRFFSYF